MQNKREEEGNGSGDGGENVNVQKGQQGVGGGTIGFWNSELKATRLEVFKKWAITSVCPSFQKYIETS